MLLTPKSLLVPCRSLKRPCRSHVDPLKEVLALNRVTVVAVTTVLLLHVGVFGSRGIWGAARPSNIGSGD